MYNYLKHLCCFFILLIGVIIFSNCSGSLKSIKYNSTLDSAEKNGIIYRLPKNLLKVDITYTLNEPRQIINGIDRKIISQNKPAIISIDKPILVSTLLVPDDKETYIITGKRIKNNFFVKSTLDINVSPYGLLKSIDADIDDQSIEFGEKLVIASAKLAKSIINPTSILSDGINGLNALNNLDRGKTKEEALKKLNELANYISRYDNNLLKQIILLENALISSIKKEEIESLIKKINHFKSQIEWFQKNNRTYYKSKEIKYSIIIDPFKKYDRQELKTNILNNKTVWTHSISPEHLFKVYGEITGLKPIQISIEGKPAENSPSEVFKANEKDDVVNGILTRNPLSAKIDLMIEDKIIGTNIVYLAQLGHIAIIPVKSKRGGKAKIALKFDEATGALIQHKVENSSTSEKVGNSVEKSVDSIQSSIDYIKYEKQIKELEALKKQKELLESLKDPETPIESDYDKTLKELQQKQSLLDLQLKIKELEKKVEELNNN